MVSVLARTHGVPTPAAFQLSLVTPQGFGTYTSCATYLVLAERENPLFT